MDPSWLNRVRRKQDKPQVTESSPHLQNSPQDNGDSGDKESQPAHPGISTELGGPESSLHDTSMRCEHENNIFDRGIDIHKAYLAVGALTLLKADGLPLERAAAIMTYIKKARKALDTALELNDRYRPR